MKKQINLIIVILLILNALIIYFSFFGFTTKSKTEELATESGIIKSISVEYEAYGNPFSGVKITNIDNTTANINNIATKVDSPFDISGNFSNFQLKEATVSIKYDEEKLGEDVSEEDLVVLWYDEENNKMVEMPTKVDAEKNKVTFETDHFSQYVLVDKTVWQGIWEKEVAKVREEDVEFSVEFIIDDSGSMSSNDPSSRRISATKAAISALSNEDEYLVMKFSDGSEVLQDFTTNNVDAEAIFEQFSNSGGTNISGAVEKGIDLLKKEDDDREKIIILLTDGEDSGLKSRVEELSEKAKEENIKIFGIGLQPNDDENPDFEVFSNLATQTNGKFYKITETQLSNIFVDITNATVGVDGELDTDGDGLPDGIELNGIRDQYGNILVTNPYLADTDGDGKSDKDEIGNMSGVSDGKIYYERVSHPLINEDNPEMLLNYYHLGPTKTGEDVHDSGFRPNVNALSFPNIALGEDGGYCAGYAYFTEKVYNGKLTAKNGVYGKYLSESTFGTLIKSKRLYDYKIGIDKLSLRLGPDDANFSNKIALDEVQKDSDIQIVKEIQENFLDANNGWSTAYRSMASPTYFTDKMINQIADIFDRNEIVSIGLNRVDILKLKTSYHLINAYALEKMSDTEYRLYVYDNNFPYNPYYCRDAYNGNLYITLKKVDSNRYNFEYAPFGDDKDEEFGYHWRSTDATTGMSVYYDGKHLSN